MATTDFGRQPWWGGEFAGKPFWVSMAAMVTLVVLDQTTKNWAESQLVKGEAQDVLGSLLRFRLIYNPGAAFSFLTNATWVFTILATVAVIGLTWLLSRKHPMIHRVAFVLMLSGAAGNLIDRLARQPGFGVGHVVDFIELPKWPIFNVADICVTTAAVLLVLSTLLPGRFGIETTESAHSGRNSGEGTQRNSE